MDKIKRMAKMYGCVAKDEPWEFKIDVLKDGVVEEFFFNDEEKACWFHSKASKLAEEIRGWHKWMYDLLPW